MFLCADAQAQLLEEGAELPAEEDEATPSESVSDVDEEEPESELSAAWESEFESEEEAGAED